MATVNGPKYMGPVVIDLSKYQNDLIDLPPGAMRGIRAEQAGIDAVLSELATAIPAHGDAADISPQVYKRVVERTALIEELHAKEIELDKLQEVVRETRAKLENDREDDLGLIAQAAQKASERKKDPGVAAPFAETIRYNSQIAEKGVQTRKKNEAAKADAAKADAAKNTGG